MKRVSEQAPPGGRRTKRGQFAKGVMDTIPITAGAIPFGMVCGIAAIDIGLRAIEGQGLSLIVFAGASQLVAIQLLSENAPALVIVLSILVVNLRFLMYSASLAPHFQPYPFRWRAGLSHFVTDQGYAVAIVHYDAWPENPYKNWYFLGSAIVMWSSWQAGTLLGIVIGEGIPETWSFAFAVPLTFLALVVPTLKDRSTLAAFVVGGTLAVAARGLPLNLGLVSGAVAGVLTGMLVEARR